MSAIQALMERELGRTALELLGEQAATVLVPAAEKRALNIVQAIQSVLGDESRSDSACVEEIVSILAQAGVPTPRHDFG